ncbi:MAG: GDP-mannose 4,6-dehydratase, partial [Terriglobales bacterium]
YQHPEKLIPLAIANAQELQPIPLYGSGAQVRNWIHVEDHCRGILQALERGRPGEVYHLGGDAELDNRSLLQRLLRILDRPLELIQPVPDRPGHDFRYALDSARARQELGWQPQIDLAAGLEATVAWYRHNQDWLAQARDGAYRQFYRSQYPALQATEAG